MTWIFMLFFFFSSRRRHTRCYRDWNSDVCSSDLIDDVLKGHPGVQFAMAVPFENRYYGEEIAACVVLREGMTPPTEAVLLEFCRGRLPFSKRPKVIMFGQDVPYTTTGKPKRLELKTRLAE